MTISRIGLAIALCGFATPTTAQLIIFPVPQKAVQKCRPASAAQQQRALADAKRHLPKFWQSYRDAWVKQGRFVVLGSFLRRDGSYAYLWSEVTGIRGSTFQGRLMAADTIDPAFRKNDKTDGPMDSVLDWGVRSQMSGLWYGRFLQRASLPNCTSAQRADLMARIFTKNAVP